MEIMDRYDLLIVFIEEIFSGTTNMRIVRGMGGTHQEPITGK
jgi:hypothetical protein